MLSVIEIDADDQIAAHVLFDPDDIDAAFAELDARYLAGEAAAHAHTWSVIAGAYAALNRRELPATTPDWVTIDHRRVTRSSPATWPPTSVPRGTSRRTEHLHRGRASAERPRSGRHPGGEWDVAAGLRAPSGGSVDVMTVDGDLISRCEFFDETDLDAALARFDELSRPAPRLENAASRVTERFWRTSRPTTGTPWPRSWPTTFPPTIVVAWWTPGVRRGREAEIADVRAIADLGVDDHARRTSIATRGERLVLGRIRFSGRDQRPRGVRHVDVLGVVEIDADNRIAATRRCSTPTTSTPPSRSSTPDTSPAKRPPTRTRGRSSSGTYAALNRHELPATTPDWVNVDHRHVTAIAPGDLIANLRASWDLTPEPASTSRPCIG